LGLAALKLFGYMSMGIVDTIMAGLSSMSLRAVSGGGMLFYTLGLDK
jgi:hypothetical protein